MAWVLDEALKRLNARLFQSLGRERYELWARHVRPALLDEEVFVFHLPDAFLKDKVEGLLRGPVTEAARAVANRNVRVRFEVERHSFPTPAPPAAPEEGPPATFATTAVGSGNRLAVAAARAFVEGFPSARTLLLVAPSGLGKTHLLEVIAAELSGRPGVSLLRFTGGQFRRYFDYAFHRGNGEAFLAKCRSAQVFLLDGIQFLCGRPEAQEALAGVLDAIEARRGRVALTCERHPRLLEGLSNPLRRRLRAQIEISIERPDPATGAAVLRSRAPRGTPAAVLEYIAAHVQSNHTDQLWCLARTLELGPPTAASVRAVVGEFLNQWSRGLTYADIVRAAAETFGVSVGEIYSDERGRAAAEARQACYYLARKLLGHPFAQIGDHFGGRDHSTVLEACRKLRHRRGGARERLKRLEAKLQPEARS